MHTTTRLTGLPPLLSQYCYQRYHENPDITISKCDQMVDLFLKTLGLTAGFGAALLFAKVALAYPERTVATISAVGCEIGFGSFFAEALVEIVERMRHPELATKTQLKRNYRSKVVLTATVCAAVFFGVLSQFGLLQTSHLFFDRGATAVGVGAMLGSSGPLILSVFDSLLFLDRCARAGYNRLQKDEHRRLLQTVKSVMIDNFAAKSLYGLTIDDSVRNTQFRLFYQNSRHISINSTSGNDGVQSSPIIDKAFLELVQPIESKPQLYQRSVCSITSEVVTRIALAVMAVFFLYEQGLLTKEAAEGVINIAFFMWLLTIASFSPWPWKALTVPYKCASSMFNQALSLVGCGQPTTFVERFYPRISKSIGLLMLGGTALSGPQIVTLAGTCCYKASTPQGKVYITFSMLIIMSFFYMAAKGLAERGVIAADVRFGSDEMKELIRFNDNCKELHSVLEDLSLDDLDAFLSANKINPKDMLQKLQSNATV